MFYIFEKTISNNWTINYSIDAIRINHISNVLRQLKNKNIVECMNEDAHKGRLYRLTPTGKEILKSIEKDEKKINSN